MALIPVLAHLYPSALVGFSRMADADAVPPGDPRIATDHEEIWKVLLALEFVLGLNAAGRFLSVESRILNAMRVQTQIETAPNTGANSWHDGHTVNWSATGPLFTISPPVVLCTYRGAIADNNTPARFWVSAFDELGGSTVIKARAKDGSELTGVTNHTVSVTGIALAEPAE